jgi:hypothetical protein
MIGGPNPDFVKVFTKPSERWPEVGSREGRSPEGSGGDQHAVPLTTWVRPRGRTHVVERNNLRRGSGSLLLGPDDPAQERHHQRLDALGVVGEGKVAALVENGDLRPGEVLGLPPRLRDGEVRIVLAPHDERGRQVPVEGCGQALAR